MDKYINAKSLYNQVAEKEELARQRVIDTPSRLPNGDVNPYAIRYAAQLDERTTFKFMLADAPAADVVDRKALKEIKQIIDTPNTAVQEDVLKYKMICEVVDRWLTQR